MYTSNMFSSYAFDRTHQRGFVIFSTCQFDFKILDLLKKRPIDKENMQLFTMVSVDNIPKCKRVRNVPPLHQKGGWGGGGGGQ